MTCLTSSSVAFGLTIRYCLSTRSLTFFLNSFSTTWARQRGDAGRRIPKVTHLMLIEETCEARLDRLSLSLHRLIALGQFEKLLDLVLALFTQFARLNVQLVRGGGTGRVGRVLGLATLVPMRSRSTFGGQSEQPEWLLAAD